MPADSRPNILLIMTDQQRGDALGIEGHPVLQTPNLDWLAASGVRFARAYSACPVCVPARRTLMTGQRPATHGALANVAEPLHGPTLPGELARHGYQTHLVGKLHLAPPRQRYGFQSMVWADSPRPGSNNPRAGTSSDYQRFLWREGVHLPRASEAHGIDQNGWVARPWHLDERYHFTNWCVDQAIDFLERRDPSCPFFLKVSIFHPHQPLTPPRVYYDRYLQMGLPEPYVGDWARVYDAPVRGLTPKAWRVYLEPAVMHQYRAAYYGAVNHIDDQLGRLLPLLPRETVVLFTADHGEMLGDHQWIRKRTPYEPSARIPFILRLPKSLDLPQKQVIHRPVELMDVMPTLLELAGVPVPETVEGRSVLPLLSGSDDWRPYLHGECAHVPDSGAEHDSGMQYLTDGVWKYVWWPALGREQLFHLAKDPQEMHDLAASDAHREELARWRARLVQELAGRPEGFTDGERLLQLDGPTPTYIG